MTFYYKTYSWSQNNAGVPEETRKLWEHIAEKKNWRIVQLPNGFYQTECQSLTPDGEPSGEFTDVTRRETVDGAEAAIDGSVDHYGKKVEFLNGPKVVKTFK